ncbi:hypothetical protein NKR19_g9178 [Coniochaeta hoffmannii]|uniref:CmcJ-like methyltransferase n=1 Tax=Coniochaeta hoffmannii TaxID=91930 RepID=A0AA38R4D4_9PEZI|nr:hypothetical protein NKR19_g9178 [Coniochaeta hoffmannii]
MRFLKPKSWDPGEKLYELEYNPSDGLAERNYDTHQIYDIPIHDLRPLKGKLSLDREGFVILDLPSSMKYEDYLDETKLKSVFAEELRQCLLNTLGARAVFIHECVIRKRDKEGFVRGEDDKGYGLPIPLAHTDYTVEYISRLIGQLFGDQADDIRKHRFQMINVWKPLRGPLRDWPLAMCDIRSVDTNDMQRLDEVHTEDFLESYQIQYNEGQKWWYLSEQRPDEVLVFKGADSEIRGAVPHGSFCDPRCPEDEPKRESIECRVLVVY